MDSRPPDNAPDASGTGVDEIARRIREISAENDRLFGRLMEGERHFRGLAKSVWQVQEEERRRLALELHDGIGQTLTALKNFLQRECLRTTDEGTKSICEQAHELATTALEDTRELSRLLRPPVLDDLGLEAALKWLARINRERTGLAVELEWKVDEDRLDSQFKTLVFRTVQEALNNVVRHAHADRARVSAVEVGDRLSVTVIDDGRGFDPETVFDRTESDGFGLRGLRDRVELFGGRVSVHSEPDEGSRIAFSIPLPGGPS